MDKENIYEIELKKIQELYKKLSDIGEKNKETIVELIEITRNDYNAILIYGEGKDSEHAKFFIRYLDALALNIEIAQDRYETLVKQKPTNKFGFGNLMNRLQKRDVREERLALAECKLGLSYNELSKTESRDGGK